MKKFFIAAVFGLAACLAFAEPAFTTYSKDQLRTDFDYFIDVIKNNHPKLYSDKAALENLAAANAALIRDGMTELEFYRLLSPIVSKLNCGHTRISLSPATDARLSAQARAFPLALRFSGGRAFAIGNGYAKEVPLGAEILSVNGRPMAEIVKALFANLSSDGQNETRKYYLLNEAFSYFYLCFVEAPDSFSIEYRPAGDSGIRTAVIPGVTMAQADRASEEVKGAGLGVPFAKAFTDSYALLRMNTFYPEGRYTVSSFNKFLNAFFMRVKARKIAKVILDVRDNGGGDPRVTSHLFSYLAKVSQPYFAPSALDNYKGLKSPVPLAKNHFDGALYVLMNGGSFSSSGHLVALLKFQGVGTFIGEESGASFAGTDSSRDFILPSTRIKFRSSTMVWEVAVSGLVPGRGIMPDYEIGPSAQDYIDKRDAALDFAVELLKRAK